MAARKARRKKSTRGKRAAARKSQRGKKATAKRTRRKTGARKKAKAGRGAKRATTTVRDVAATAKQIGQILQEGASTAEQIADRIDTVTRKHPRRRKS
jgi:hypothetical protein